MVGFDYGRMQSTASRLLDLFAQGVVQLTRTATADPHPATPWVPGTSTTMVYTLDATVRGVSAAYVDGTTILSTDLEVTCAVLAVTPQMTDTLTIDGKVRTIKKVVRLPAAGVAVAFKLFVAG